MTISHSQQHIQSPPRRVLDWARHQVLGGGSRGRALLWLAALVALWTALTAWQYKSPPWDNAEELVWSASLEWGYYKHPPLPTWILGLLVRLLGREVWITYAAAMLCVATALWFVWRLGCAITTPARAALGAALVSVIGYHSLGGVVFNHNTVQLAPVALFWWALHRASYPSHDAARVLAAWRWVGLAAGMALLTKYSAVVQLAVAAGLILHTGRWRDGVVRQGMAQALLITSLMVLPHLLWVLDHPQASLGYAQDALTGLPSHGAALARLWQVAHVQLARLLPMLALVGLAWVLAWRWRGPGQPLQRAGMEVLPDAFDRRFVLWAAWGPLALAALIALALRAPMATAWPATFFLPWGLLVLTWLPRVGTADAARRQRQWLLGGVLVLQVLMAVGQGVGRGALSSAVGRACRANLPAVGVGQALRAVWDDALPRAPLAYVAGETWFAANVAIQAGPGTEVLVDGELIKSPWVRERRLQRCGMLVVLLDTPGFGRSTPALEALYASSTVRGQWRRPWTQRADGPEVQVRWGIVPPTGQCAQEGGPAPKPRRSAPP